MENFHIDEVSDEDINVPSNISYGENRFYIKEDSDKASPFRTPVGSVNLGGNGFKPQLNVMGMDGAGLLMNKQSASPPGSNSKSDTDESEKSKKKDFWNNGGDDTDSSDDSEEVVVNKHQPKYPFFQKPVEQQQPEESPEVIIARKKELLYQFSRLEKKGTVLPRKFTLNSSVEEMESELERIKKEKEIDNSIRFQRNMLVAFTSGVEFINTKFDPFNVKLDGWSENINENIDGYDEIFEELHEKYNRKTSLPPEVRLLMSLVGSGFMFHLTNSMFKSNTIPGVEEVMKSNPDLMKQFAGTAANMMAQNEPTGIASMFGNMFNPQQQQQPQQQQPLKPKMKGPTDIDDILKELEGDMDRVEEISTLSQSDISELQGSVSGIYTNGRGRRSMNVV